MGWSKNRRGRGVRDDGASNHIRLSRGLRLVSIGRDAAKTLRIPHRTWRPDALPLAVDDDSADRLDRSINELDAGQRLVMRLRRVDGTDIIGLVTGLGDSTVDLEVHQHPRLDASLVQLVADHELLWAVQNALCSMSARWHPAGRARSRRLPTDTETADDRRIEHALCLWAQHCGADRAYLTIAVDDDDAGRPVWRTIRQWCRAEPGAERTAPRSDDAEMSMRFGALRSGRVVDIPPPDRGGPGGELAGEPTERRQLAETGIDSLFELPLGLGGRVVGCVGLEWRSPLDRRLPDRVTAAALAQHFSAAVEELAPCPETASVRAGSRASPWYRHRRLVEQLRDPVARVDDGGRVLLSNAAARRLIPGVATGRVRMDRTGALARPITDALRGDVPLATELRVVDGGEVRVVSVRVHPEQEVDGVVSVLLIGEDRTPSTDQQRVGATRRGNMWLAESTDGAPRLGDDTDGSAAVIVVRIPDLADDATTDATVREALFREISRTLHTVVPTRWPIARWSASAFAVMVPPLATAAATRAAVRQVEDQLADAFDDKGATVMLSVLVEVSGSRGTWAIPSVAAELDVGA